jgi:SAM-dependent methyltransferase
MNGLLYDVITAFAERRMIAPLRERLLRPLRGTVIDVGAGTGANFRYYHPSVHVIGLEPDLSMRRRAVARATRCAAAIEVRPVGSQSLSAFAPLSVDAVVFALVLCTIDDALDPLRQASRILRPGGRVVVLEHVRSSGRWGCIQDCIAPVWRAIAGGCRLNRKTEDLLAAAGFETSALKRVRISRLFLIRDLIVGTVACASAHHRAR